MVPLHTSGTDQPALRGFLYAHESGATRRKTIHDIPNEVLLEIFNHYRLGCEISWEGVVSKAKYARMDLSPWWNTLERVCRWWHQVIRASPRRLDLKLQYIRGMSIQAMLENAPSSFPLSINFPSILHFRKKDTPALKLVLQQTERFREATLYSSGPAFAHLINVMTVPLPRLERLTLVENDGHPPIADLDNPLPPSLLGGHAPDLTLLNLRGVTIREVPHWTATATNLTSLHLNRVSISTGVLFTVLQSTPRLKVLVLDFVGCGPPKKRLPMYITRP
ncbi:hypothetical protein BC834DRAFT_435411 [Gloeopeniophorella convolvens]|nr:hypothetical protein BC834DRAFT_435411 [Gloeopeniophorella convolvens]